MEFKAKRHFSSAVYFAMLLLTKLGPRPAAKRRTSMVLRLICSALLVAGALALSPLGPAQAAQDDGIVKFKSAYPCRRQSTA